MHLAHSKTAVIDADGELRGIFKNETPKIIHPGQPIATQDNFTVNDGTELEVKRQIAKILSEITDREENCLKTIHTRYCIINGFPISVSEDVKRFVPDPVNRKNYWEYWYKWGTKEEQFLMSREVIAEGNEFKLNIIFSMKLAREGEND